jgi:BirA family biotin operon repressor/biotin-[acetyl-CoA-carboxylase] ligase
MAETQFAGRGQHNNVWHAQPGKNLTFSLLLKPSFISPQQQFELTRAISLGVYDALHPLLRDRLKIKWPNDIYFGDKKLGGMLIENMIQGGQIKSSIVGIGINVNQDNFSVESGAPVSIRQILQRDYDLQHILSQICNHVEAWYLKLKAGNFDVIRSNYLAVLYRLNEQHFFRSNNHVFMGEIVGVTAIGQLVVLSDGEEKLYNLKEIEFFK